METLKLSQLMNGMWKDYSISTCAERAIPHVVDGLKPVQRFVLLSGFENAKNKFAKVNAVASVISSYGYEHGEQSAVEALTKMGQYFSNNLPLFEGQGNFGNKLQNEPSAGRYIFVKLQSFIDSLFKDTEFAPDNEDPEIKTKKYYLPIIPMLLVNGISGIATGYSCHIAPYDPLSIIDSLLTITKGKKYKPIVPKFYDFSGNVETTNKGFVLKGVVEKKSNIHYIVKDIPVLFHNSSSYESILRTLQEKEIISSYDNMSSNDVFQYDVWFKKGSNVQEEKVPELLKLSWSFVQNITTIMLEDKLHIWNDANDVVKWFYDFRIPFVQKRIDTKVIELKELIAYYNGFIKFIKSVIDNKINLKNISEEDLRKNLDEEFKIPSKYIDSVLNSPLRTLTVNKIKDLEEKLKIKKEEYDYYSHTTKEIEYEKDLLELKSKIEKYIRSLKQENS